ncbi:hypothetical protein FGG78_38340 [Thioclava sp. BHET1]|nr:hypothetical protein FGG78_38340 [Thioclava sp. BHET1]
MKNNFTSEIVEKVLQHESGVEIRYFEVIFVAPSGASIPFSDQAFDTREEAEEWIRQHLSTDPS